MLVEEILKERYNLVKNKMIDISRKVGMQLVESFIANNDIDEGINGPYDDSETKVRNLSHLIVITSIEIIKFGNTTLSTVLRNMGKNLLNKLTEDGLFVMRKKQGKDISNGVIGHAWVIEGLTYLYIALNDKIFLDVADGIARKHKFDEKLGLWNTPEYLTNKSKIDYTFNHQLWYAASLAELNVYLHSNIYLIQIESFIKNLPINFNVRCNGRVCHEIYNRNSKLELSKRYLKKTIIQLQEMMNKPSLKYKEDGYHLFNIFAFARLYNIYANEIFWNGNNFIKAFSYSTSLELQKGLLSGKIELDCSMDNKISNEDEKKINIFGYPYNVPGFEWPYISKVFGDYVKKDGFNEDYYCDKQIELTYNNKNNKFENKCHDKIVINYRVYELYRCWEIED